MQKILSLLRRCVEDYQMIAPGERVGVGCQGKDSLLLLAGLARLARFYPGGSRWRPSPWTWASRGWTCPRGGLVPAGGHPLPPDPHPDVPRDL